MKFRIILTVFSVLFAGLFAVVSTEETRTDPLPSVSPAVEVSFSAADGTLVDLNFSDAETLKTLPGIGQSKAEAILAYREQNGYFLTAEEIKNVSGIGNKIYDNLAEYIVVGEMNLSKEGNAIDSEN